MAANETTNQKVSRLQGDLRNAGRSMAEESGWQKFCAVSPMVSSSSEEEEMTLEEKGREFENGDSRGLENKAYKRKCRSSESSGAGEKEKSEGLMFPVGMRVVSRSDGVFRDPHVVGKFVEEKVGVVRSIRITRSGMVIIDCVNKRQADKVLKISEFVDRSRVKCFPIWQQERKKGVVSGVPMSVDAEVFVECVENVEEARRMERYREGKKELSGSICLTFNAGVELPERVYVDYVCYKVRPYERAPLRCFCCQQYGHVAAVCRGVRRCGKCGMERCEEEDCTGEVKCLHCGGLHHVGAAQCPKQIKEKNVNAVRGKNGISYAEAVKRVEINVVEVEAVVKVSEPKRNGDEQNICVDKMGFLSFMAMVVNCADQVQGKKEKIKMVVDAARRFLNIMDISGEDIEKVLRDEFAQTRTLVSES